jgi:hypothetical protein
LRNVSNACDVVSVMSSSVIMYVVAVHAGSGGTIAPGHSRASAVRSAAKSAGLRTTAVVWTGSISCETCNRTRTPIPRTDERGQKRRRRHDDMNVDRLVRKLFDAPHGERRDPANEMRSGGCWWWWIQTLCARGARWR